MQTRFVRFAQNDGHLAQTRVGSEMYHAIYTSKRNESCKCVVLYFRHYNRRMYVPYLHHTTPRYQLN
jgi:hypothetical protein